MTERIKKIGSLTSFNLFLMSELEVMGKLLTHVKSTLLVRLSFMYSISSCINNNPCHAKVSASIVNLLEVELVKQYMYSAFN